MTQPIELCPTTRLARIESALRNALPVTFIEVIDDSHMHVGHAGARDGRGHYRVRIVSDVFSNMRILARQQLVYKALGALMQTEIHALGIEASTPAEAGAAPSSSNSEIR